MKKFLLKYFCFSAPPPSYDSLFGRVRGVRKMSRGFLDYMKNLFFFLLGKSNDNTILSLKKFIFVKKKLFYQLV